MTPDGEPTTLSEVICSNASLRGGKVAFVDENRQVSFAQFNGRVNRLCNALQRLGIRKGDRVAFLSRNCIEYVELYGVAKSGSLAVPLNWRLAMPELVAVVQDCAPAVLVVEEGQIAAIDAERPNLADVTHFVALGPPRAGWLSYEELLADAAEDEPEYCPAPHDIACITYTSGTTGRPKGVMLRHDALVENAAVSAAEAMGLSDADVTLAVMPLFHVGGMWYHLFASFATGCTTFIRPAFDPADALSAIETNGITNVHLVPTMLGDLIGQPGTVAAARSLRLVFYAASSMPVELLQRSMGVLSHCHFLQCYGSTEAGMVTALLPSDHEEAVRNSEREHLLLSCGQALRGVQVRIDRDIGVPDDIGEVLVGGSKIMAGYWGRDDATRASLSDGWLRTGDLGRIDDEGYLYIVDRKSDMVISGGENIFPSEVEQVLYRHPEILEAAVLGVADARWVEKVVAAVVLKPGSALTPGDIIQFVRRHLASYKCPKLVLIMDNLPRSGAGKVLRKDLRNRFDVSNQTAD
ncbi:class I adenylate-forming enzyme family protein [Roseomonas sp. KE2513]|uniref:class I adenylate-forming enzyme family protein n=1 Tax=Roseomonas sp. KE2513 TaxID=2479202 RepID=UPI0018DFD423|nr:long-chain-fatty-acid--CoA ligase [Roseomonas sp. KE2513]